MSEFRHEPSGNKLFSLRSQLYKGAHPTRGAKGRANREITAKDKTEIYSVTKKKVETFGRGFEVFD